MRFGILEIYGIDVVYGYNNVYGVIIFFYNIGLGCMWYLIFLVYYNYFLFSMLVVYWVVYIDVVVGFIIYNVFLLYFI